MSRSLSIGDPATAFQGVFHQLARDFSVLGAYLAGHGHAADHHLHQHHPDDYPGAGARGLDLSARRPVRGGAVFSSDR